jgi:hypothetical protein
MLAHHSDEDDEQAVGAGAYTPCPVEIRHRLNCLWVLKDAGFSGVFMDSCMTHDTPPFTTVQRLLTRGSAAEQIEALYEDSLVRVGDGHGNGNNTGTVPADANKADGAG